MILELPNRTNNCPWWTAVRFGPKAICSIGVVIADDSFKSRYQSSTSRACHSRPRKWLSWPSPEEFGGDDRTQLSRLPLLCSLSEIASVGLAEAEVG